MSNCQRDILTHEIPKWIPREMSWVNPNRSYAGLLGFIYMACIVAGIIGLFLYVGIGLYTIISQNKLVFHGLLRPISVVAFGFCALGILCRILIGDRGPARVEINSSEFVATAIPIIKFPRLVVEMKPNCKWDDIYSAQWDADEKLVIEHPGGTVILPHNDQTTRILALGIIRALRERENPIVLTIPDDLLAVIDGHNQQSQV
jgi:hypothetical protein